MAAFVVLLRGINVGKAKRIPMAELKALLSGLGCSAVKTLLNSGNAVVEIARATPASLAKKVEAAIVTRFGFEVPTVALSAVEFRSIVDANPYASDHADPGRLLVAFCLQRDTLAGLAAVTAHVVAPERFHVGPQAAYLDAVNGILDSKAAVALLGKSGQAVTTRNWATVQKIAALL